MLSKRSKPACRSTQSTATSKDDYTTEMSKLNLRQVKLEIADTDIHKGSTHTNTIKSKGDTTPGKLSQALIQLHEDQIHKSGYYKPRERVPDTNIKRKSDVVSNLNPQPTSNLRFGDLSVNTSSIRSPIPAVLSPSGPTAGRVVDTTISVKRYSLFGPSVAPFWEYYTGITGITPIPANTPSWRVSVLQRRNCQIVHAYMRKEELLRKRREFERIEQERQACVPEWMRLIIERRRRKLLDSKLDKTQGQRRANDGDSYLNSDLPPWQQELIQRRKKKRAANKLRQHMD